MLLMDKPMPEVHFSTEMPVFMDKSAKVMFFD